MSRRLLDDIDSRVEYLVKILVEMTEDKKELYKVVQKQVAIVEMSSHFACIAHACSLKSEKGEDFVRTASDEEKAVDG
jgi:hypothetical protein